MAQNEASPHAFQKDPLWGLERTQPEMLRRLHHGPGSVGVRPHAFFFFFFQINKSAQDQTVRFPFDFQACMQERVLCVPPGGWVLPHFSEWPQSPPSQA